MWCLCHVVRQAHRGLTVGFLLCGIQMYVLLSPYLCCISFLYLDLYVLGNDASISEVSLMRTKHLFVLIHIRIMGEVGTVEHN